MKRFFRCCTIVLGAGSGLFLLAGLILYAIGMQKFTESYPDIPVETITVPSDVAAIERGQHIASTWSCTYCHADDLSGSLVENDGLMGTVPATNLTSGNGGIGQSYADIDWIRAIRHGVKPDGRVEIRMNNYYLMSDQDLSDLIAYLKQIPPVDSNLPNLHVGPILALAPALGEMMPAAEEIDHQVPRPADLGPGATVEYGSYLSVNCMGCHSPNLGLKVQKWNQADFFRMLQTGNLPDGGQLGSGMPVYSEMNDTELTALWTYFQSLPREPQK